ncbi:MAG: hypothetical protein JSU61_04660 [Fidelibacterota bacterium]|nr:MAG: hypothetical protein JSU61_04660 [Candidatus Neomarinimicrobiota bacterium]
MTLHRPLSRKDLRKLAYPGKPSVKGRALYADLHVQMTIRSSYKEAGYSRVTIEPIFMVYISRWRDRRQWIQWRSNGVLEADLLSFMEAYLAPGN